MKLELYRYGENENSTGGALSVNNAFCCHTCEDAYHAEKIYGKTRIPAGVYKIKFRNAGGMNEDFKKRFPFHQGMLHLKNVPGYEWVYIHPGNNAAQTEGCILVGFTALSKDGFFVGRSTDAYIKLYEMIVDASNRGEDIYIQITDGVENEI